MKENTSKKTGVFLMIALCLLTFIGCPEDRTPPRPEPVKVGVLFPMTGDLADKGRDSADGVRLAVEEINAAGGVASLGGAMLAPVIADTAGRPGQGVRETERLITQEQVTAVIGAYQSSVTKAATRAAERWRTPFIVSISIADIITERGFRYTFRIQPKASFYARDQIRFLSDLETLAGYRVKRVALLHENTDFGTSCSFAQKLALREKGMEPAVEISYAAEGATDLSAEVREVLAARPDAIITVTYLNDSILIRRALASAGSRIPVLDTAGGTVSPEYVKILGPLAEGTLTSSEYSKFAEGGKKLNNRFRKRFGVDITGDSAHAYQAVWVLKDALERAASADREKVRQAIAATDMPKGPQMVLPAARLRFDASGQNETARLFIVQIQKGEWVPVWPTGYATGSVMLDGPLGQNSRALSE